MKIVVPAIILSLLSACSGSVHLVSARFGSDVNTDNGRISDDSLTYVFHNNDKDAMLGHYFDYVYFQGDTLCFSFKIVPLKKSSRVQVWFILKGKKFPAERLETSKNIVWGFSLIGSLLENSYRGRLNDNFNVLSFPLNVSTKLLLDYSDDETNFIRLFSVSFKVID